MIGDDETLGHSMSRKGSPKSLKLPFDPPGRVSDNPFGYDFWVLRADRPTDMQREFLIDNLQLVIGGVHSFQAVEAATDRTPPSIWLLEQSKGEL